MTATADPTGPLATDRPVLLVTNTGRAEARSLAWEMARGLLAAGIELRAPADEVDELNLAQLRAVPGDEHAAHGCELVVVVGGDGTVLRAAERARADGVPLLGVNMGRVGFLAEAERDDLASVVHAVATRSYEVEERLTLDVRVLVGTEVMWSTWALNEASVEKDARERMLELVLEVDHRPLSRWGCDGVVCATPTGSTAYAWSAGGPVVWPQVEALVAVPISAHALFARPLVVAPNSVLAVEVLPGTGGAVVWCDGRRMTEVPPGARVEVRRHPEPVRFARLHPSPFTDRLVAKFSLPVQGWRGEP